MEIAQIGGVSLKVHPTFWLVLLAYGALGLFTQALLVFLLVMGHELAHLLTAKAYGFKVIGIELYPFGGAAHCDDLFEGRKVEESLMALAGPTFNLVLFFIGVVLQWEGLWTGKLTELFISVNFWLAIFNLIPVLPLDGGRIARALFADTFGFVNTTKVLARAGQGLGIIFAVVGVMFLAKGHYEWIATCWLLGGFFWVSGNKEVEGAHLTFLRQITRKKEELLRKGLMKSKNITVTEETPLIRIVETLTPDRYSLINLSEGEKLGLKTILTETEIVEGMLEKGIHFPVGKLIRKE